MCKRCVHQGSSNIQYFTPFHSVQSKHPFFMEDPRRSVENGAKPRDPFARIKDDVTKCWVI